MAKNRDNQTPAPESASAAASPSADAGSYGNSNPSAPAQPEPARSLPERLEAAVEKWYEGHYHRGMTLGHPIIPADDKAALLSGVLEAAASPQQQE
jgi:hypothetical protein